MAKKPRPPKPISWNVYRTVWWGEVEALDESGSMEKAEIQAAANRLMALRR